MKHIAVLLLLTQMFRVLPAFAAEPPGDYLLQMAKVDYHLRQGEFARAVEELGRVPKEQQGDPLFQKYTDKALKGLYGPDNRRPRAVLPVGQKPPHIVRERLRVTRHRKDADSRSDQSPDSDGLHASEHLEADVEGKHNSRGRFVVDLEGFKDGHNDVRYRTLLADFYDKGSHFALGDSASYLSPYFLRGSRLRGLDVLLPGKRHELQAVAGAYPVWLESRDEYIYPRKVWGLRDKWILFDERMKLGGNFIQTRDTGRIRTEDGANPGARTGVANQIRDNLVFSLDQEMKLIPEVWYLKASEAWSDTDDDLNDNRFGDSTKLKDKAVTAESLMVQPWGQLISRYERTGPDFRLLTDLPAGAVNNPKTLTVDRQLIEQALDLKPFGPLDLDLQASWYRNNLGHRDDIETTRQSWYTAELGVLTPYGWPRPRLRTTMIDTVSSPGPVNYPNQTRTYLLHPEVSQFIAGWHVTGFADYQNEIPMEDKDSFSAEERWSLGSRLATTLANRLTFSPHYTYRVADEDVDVARDGDLERLRVRSTRHETGISTSYRLWDTASVGLSYDYLRGKLPGYTSARLARTNGYDGTASFTWPYTRRFRGNRRKVGIFPGILFHFTDLRKGMGRHPLATGRLSMAYEAVQEWKLELMGEFRYDGNIDTDNMRTEESRLWLLWSSEWK